MRIYRLIAAIRFWFKILHSDDMKYIKVVYNMMIEDLQSSPEKASRAKSVKSLLERLGFGHVWITQGVGGVNMFLSVFKQRLTDNFIQGWHEEVSNSSRANNYKLLADFNFKMYLDLVTINSISFDMHLLGYAWHRIV